MADFRDGVRRAMAAHHLKLLPKQTKRRGKNASPEKDLEKLVLAWLRKYKFDCNVVESKAVYSAAAGRYLSGQTDPGVSDIVGNDNRGRAVYIELKAKGKRKNLSYAQTVFLMRKINYNCFSVVVDSVDLLQEYYAQWSILVNESPIKSIRYLKEQLPQKAIKEDKTPLFDTD